MGIGASSEECASPALLEPGAHEIADGSLLASTSDAPVDEELCAPKPLTHEPGEAQREPHEWPLPLSVAVLGRASDKGHEGQCARRCRQCFRLLGGLLVVSGFIVALVGVFGRYWASVQCWALHHSFEIAGSVLVLIGLAVHCLAANPSRRVFLGVPAWDDVVPGDLGSCKLPNFRFQIWNDAARFGTDIEALERLISNGDGNASRVSQSDNCSAEYLFNEPELCKLINQARSEESEQRISRTKSIKKVLIEQCRVDLEAGMSIRRLRQKLEPRCFVIDFTSGDGSIDPQIHMLRNAVSFLLTVCTPYDEVVLRVTSRGGQFGDYGLASSQVSRLRRAGVRYVACVDVAAASGGYMLACMSDHLVAAPFAILGSIGVVAEMPNIHKVLQRHDVEYQQFTAGRFKRTVGVFTKNSDEGIAKFQDELNAVHTAFINLVAEGRGSRIEGGAHAVSTGESFLGSDALRRGLVDELATSDEYLRRRAAAGVVIVEVCPHIERSLVRDFLGATVQSAQQTANQISANCGLFAQAFLACLAQARCGKAPRAHGPAEWLLHAQMESQDLIYAMAP